jgi:hypothetical protein
MNRKKNIRVMFFENQKVSRPEPVRNPAKWSRKGQFFYPAGGNGGQHVNF